MGNASFDAVDETHCDDFTALRSVYDQHLNVVATEIVTRRPGFRRDQESVLVVDVAHVDQVASLAQQARHLSEYPIGDIAYFNIDFSRKFRYCLENGIDPTPASGLLTSHRRDLFTPIFRRIFCGRFSL